MITVRRRYRHVVEDRDRHGNVRVYLRQQGKPKIRLHADPGTAEFDIEYREALAAAAKQNPQRAHLRTASPGSLRALCAAYYNSAEFKLMQPRSQRVRRLILEKLCDQDGDKPAGQLEPKHVRQIRDARSDKPEAANGIIKALRAVYSHGVEAELVHRNPAASIKYLRKGGEGFHQWTEDQVAQFEAYHPIGSRPRLALALLVFTGQRRSDVVTLGRQHLKDGWLSFVQAKNRHRNPNRLSIPLRRELASIIASTSGVGAMTFLATDRGTPYTPESFGNVFRKWCRQAGLTNCAAHGLRKVAATRWAEAGATAHEIMSWLGHRSIKEVQRYTQGANQKRLAASALARLPSEQNAHTMSHFGLAKREWDDFSPQSFEKQGEKHAWCPGAESNHRHCDFQSHALPTELPGHRPAATATALEAGA